MDKDVFLFFLGLLILYALKVVVIGVIWELVTKIIDLGGIDDLIDLVDSVERAAFELVRSGDYEKSTSQLFQKLHSLGFVNPSENDAHSI